MCPAAFISKLFFASQIDCLYNFHNTNESTTILLFAKYEFQLKKTNFNEKKERNKGF